MARVVTNDATKSVHVDNLEVGTLVRMPGGYMGIVVPSAVMPGRNGALSFSNPRWERKDIMVNPLPSGEQVTLEQD